MTYWFQKETTVKKQIKDYVGLVQKFQSEN